MTKDILLDRIKRNNIKIYNDSFLNRNNQILELLVSLNIDMLKTGIDIVNLYDDDLLVKEAINMLKNHSNLSVGRCLTNINTINGGISITGAKILCESKEIFNASSACDVLCNKVAIDYNIALDGAKLINLAKNWYNAYYARYVFVNKATIENGYSMIGAKIINDSDKEYKALFNSVVLCSEYLIENRLVFSLIEDINLSNNWEAASEVVDKYLVKDNFKEDILYKDESYSLIVNSVIRKRVR